MSEHELPTVRFCYSEAGAGCRKNPAIVAQLLTNADKQQAVENGEVVQGIIGGHQVLIEATCCTGNCSSKCIASVNVGTQKMIIEFATADECRQEVEQVLECTSNDGEGIRTRTDAEINEIIRRWEVEAEAEFRELLKDTPKNPMT